jgi:hypothetical protein
LLLTLRATNAGARTPLLTQATYWAHIATPVVAAWLYWLHRLVGPKIKWRMGLTYAGVVAAALFMLIRVINKLQAPPPDASAPAVTPEDVLLLREIRDSLKK